MGSFTVIGDVALLDISEYVSYRHDPIHEHENNDIEEQIREPVDTLIWKGRPNRGCTSPLYFKKHVFQGRLKVSWYSCHISLEFLLNVS